MKPGDRLLHITGSKTGVYVGQQDPQTILVSVNGREGFFEKRDWILADTRPPCAVPGCPSHVDVFSFCYTHWVHVPIEQRYPIWDRIEGAQEALALWIAEKEGNVLDATGNTTIAEPESTALARIETNEAKDMLEAARGFQIETREDLELAAGTLAEVKGRLKKIDDLEKGITRPMREALEQARALFKPAKSYLAEVEIELKRAIAEREAAEAGANRAAIADVTAAHARGDEAGASEALARVTSVANVEGVQIRKALDFRIVDEAAIPRELCTPNAGLIRAAIKDGITEIPGIEIFEKAIVASRTAKGSD